jgi:hypothetical protein
MVIFIIITSISFLTSTVISYLSTINSFFPIKDWFEKRISIIATSLLSFNKPTNNPDQIVSIMKGEPKDIQPLQIYRSNIIPKIENYYDILSASVNYTNNKLLIFSMDLAGDPNKNGIYETNYVWLIYYNNNSYNKNNNNSDSKISLNKNKEQIYSLTISNFGIHSKFKLKGWYMSVFNNTNNLYTLPLIKIDNTSDNKVKAYIPPYLLGNPTAFNYITCVLVRVNSTFLEKPPDFVMDSLPSDNKFWKEWFSPIK